MIENPEIIGLVAGFLTAFSTLPQTLKLIASKRSEDLSTGTLLMLNGSYLLWLLYGIILNLLSVILWNVIALCLGTTLIILKCYIWPHQGVEKSSENSPAE